MMLPPKQLQKKWVYICKMKMKQNRTEQKAVELDNNLFNSLTQRAFRGEL
jgi:hypothetical protein